MLQELSKLGWKIKEVIFLAALEENGFLVLVLQQLFRSGTPEWRTSAQLALKYKNWKESKVFILMGWKSLVIFRKINQKRYWKVCRRWRWQSWSFLEKTNGTSRRNVHASSTISFWSDQKHWCCSIIKIKKRGKEERWRSLSKSHKQPKTLSCWTGSFYWTKQITAASFKLNKESNRDQIQSERRLHVTLLIQNFLET